MNKKSFGAFAFATLFLCILAPIVAGDAVSKAEDSTVFVRATVAKVYSPESGMPDSVTPSVPICSGFVVSSSGTEQVVVTAKHCTVVHEIQGLLEGSAGEEMLVPTSVQYFDGDLGLVHAIFRSDKYDLAVLLVHSMRYHPALRTSSTMRTGQKLFVYGMPQGDPWSYSSAVSMSGISRAPREHPFDNLVQIECASCAGGDSGGGVFDMQGRIVGVLVAGDSHAHSLIVPTSDLLEFLGGM